MADAVLLSQDTYDRIIKMLDKWEEGELPLIVDNGIKLEEVGPGGMKIGLDPSDLSGLPTIELEVCVNGSPETHTFVITDT